MWEGSSTEGGRIPKPVGLGYIRELAEHETESSLVSILKGYITAVAV